VEFLINFLTELFESGMEYSTVGNYRSAISAHHIGFQGVPAGQHPEITSLMKGMFNRRPPQPRYTDTWNVDKVLDLFRSWPEDSGLTLKNLSLKVTMLMGLTGAMRQSELHLMRVDHLTDTGEYLKFIIGGLTKTRKVGQGPLTIEFAEYAEEPKLNVVSCIRAYIARTRPLRGNTTQLLISYVKPHGAIVPCSVARWLQATMELAGIDTSIYKAHSTRSAATSKAKVMGLSAQQIMQRANWTREGTFHRYYHRGVKEQSFQKAVLT
jgi:integrase